MYTVIGKLASESLSVRSEIGLVIWTSPRVNIWNYSTERDELTACQVMKSIVHHRRNETRKKLVGSSFELECQSCDSACQLQQSGQVIAPHERRSK